MLGIDFCLSHFMRFHREIGFVLFAIGWGLALHLFHFDNAKVAQYRFDSVLQQDPTLISLINDNCSALSGGTDNQPTRHLVKAYKPSPFSAASRENCWAYVTHAQSSRSILREHWNMRLLLKTEQNVALFHRDFPLYFPTPLTLLPLVLFILAIIFKVRVWGIGWTIASYVFLLGGGNLVQLVGQAVETSSLTLTTNQSFWGLLLFLLWLSLYRGRVPRAPKRRSDHHPVFYATFHRFTALLVGLWNPAVFTLGGRLFVNHKGALRRITSFLDGQFLIICMSLYLLSVNLRDPEAIYNESLSLPRYFSFAMILFLAISYFPRQGHRKNGSWELERIWRPLLSIVLLEALRVWFPQLGTVPTTVRLGFALVLSELAWPIDLSLGTSLKNFAPWAGMLFITAFLTLVTVQSGVTDLLLVIWEPRVHPNAAALFTFVAGIFLGFITGNFPITFYALYSVLAKTYDAPLVKAALIDGILAGSLLSPFSIFNLLPATQFSVKLQDLLRFRTKQMTIPIVITMIVLATSSINSVAILQPVTFVFLCLVAITFKFRKNSWTLSHFQELKDSSL